MSIKDFKLETLKYSYSNFNIYNTITSDLKNKFLVKTTKEIHSLQSESNELINEFNILSKCDHKYILKALDKKKVDNRLFVIFEEYEGISLKENFKYINKENLNEFLSIAIKFCEVLDYLHKNGIIHNNIDADSILINKKLHDIRLLNFNYSFNKGYSCPSFNNKSFYNSPEQTDRINMEVDYKTDIFSLGILFYELLAGFIPYSKEKKDSLSYNIIAKDLPLVSNFNNDIPKVLSLIINKMIEKNPIDRYDSIFSLLLDLKKIQKRLDNNLDVLDFEINKHKKDFLIGKKTFFGRNLELSSFKKALYKNESKNQLFIIYGPSGIGKTSFVNKVLENADVIFKNFINVKFDDYKNNTPYKVLYDSFRKLAKELLIKDDETLNKWKNKILLHLGRDVKVLFGIIPELKVIISDLPEVEQLNPSESKNRFNSQLFKFLKLFSTKNNPLLIFMDDMQWADSVTIKWLENLLLNLNHVKVIMTYRDNELSKNKLLKNELKLFESFDILLNKYNLKPLNPLDIKSLLDSNITINNSGEISDLLYKKTGGNAFFVIQLLKQIQLNNTLFFDEEKNSWYCKIDELKQIKASSNIIEFLETRIASLDNYKIEFLKKASCIGNNFDIEVLKDVFKGKENFEEILNSCLQDEWITKYSIINKNFYQFSHDRIQQVFYTSINEKDLLLYHKDVGDFYYKRYKDNKEYLLTFVNHYNKAKKYFINLNKNDFLANLNHEAALIARSNGDFEMSLNFMKNAFSLYSNLKLLDTCDELFKDFAIAEHLVLNKTKALSYYKEALKYIKNDLKKAYIYEQMIKLHTDFSEFDEAYKIGKAALKLFDLNIPRGFNFLIFIKEYLELELRLKNKKVENLLNLKEAKEERAVIIIKILSSVLKAAYQIKPELCVLISMILVKSCLKYGDTKDAVIGFMVYGVIFKGGILEKHKLGYKYATLSLDMIKKYNNTVLAPEVKFVSGYFGLSWIVPASLTEQNWHESYKSGMHIGDWFHSACAAAGIVQSMFMRGVNFQLIQEQILEFEKELTKIGAREQLEAIKSVKQAIKNIQGKTNNTVSFSDESFNEEQYVKNLDNFSSLHFAHFYYINKMTSLYIHESYELAFEVSKKSRKFLNASKGMLHSCEHFFYEALIYLQCFNSFDLKDKIIYLKRVKTTIEKFEKYSKDCAENFIVRKYILNGELNRLNKDYIKAQNQFLKAIEISQIYSQHNLKIIACRLLYKIYDSLKQESFAKLYKEEFQNSFINWGAGKYLDSEENEKISVEKSLNINTLIRSSEAIFREQKLSNLLKSLIRILLENSGAQNIVIILEEDFEYKVEAIYLNDDENSFDVLIDKRYQECKNIVQNIVKYVIRTKEPVIINDLEDDPIFSKEINILQREVKSVLSFPLILRNSLKGIIYLENNLLSGVFTKEKIDLLKHLSTQIAISIENAKMYKNLEQKVHERTKDLDMKNEKLKDQNLILQEQNNKILELNSSIVEENEKRKVVEQKLQEAIKKLDQLATIDSLTQLKNRRVFDEVLKKECSRITRNKEVLSLIMCDIDFFKQYNDFYGHLQGDECLKEISKVFISNIKRKNDLVARYGGEEFAIILPNTTRKKALVIAQEISNDVRKLKIPHIKSNISDFVTLSMGIATTDDIKMISPNTLIKFADDALYRAKQNGRDQIK